ncbi:MAG: T9SS type A sorting domain-containing protein, partial [Bacteroidales bacterium]|nr:T9SS type A sorting domain-containing protein [Bacteroidales bacterium]
LKNSTVIIPDGTILGNDAIIIKEESIQQQTDPYCMEGVDGLTIKFAKLSGDKIERFKIEIEGEEKLSEYMSSEGKIKGDTIIYVRIPSDAKSRQYSGKIQFFDKSGEMSGKYDFTITVYKPSSMVKYLYHNVIFVDNHENLFSDYQWYKNGEKIDGATRQYYYEKVLNGNYYVVCKTNSGIKIKSCPVDGDLSAKISVSSVKVYPNPAKANIPFNLELVGGNGNYAGAEMLIYNNSGNLVKHITNITDIITLTLPQGNYSGALFFNGEKTGFKIIVK